MLLKTIKWIPIVLLLWNCESSSTLKGELIDFVPENPSVVITISNTHGNQTGFESFRRDLRTNSFLSALTKTKPYLFFSEKASFLETIKPSSESIFCLSNLNDSTTVFTFLTKETPHLLVLDSIKNKTVETLSYLKTPIKRITIEGEITFSAIVDSVFIASSSQIELERILDGKTEKDPNFKKIAKIKNSKSLSVILKNTTTPLTDSTSVNFASWTALDLDILPDAIRATGVALARDSVPQLLSVFKGLVPQKNEIASVIPPDAKGALLFTYNDAELLHKNLHVFNGNNASIKPINPLFESINEVGFIQLNEGKAVVLKSIDPLLTKESLLKYVSEKNSFRETTVYEFSDSELFEETLSPLIMGFTSLFSFQLDNYFIFTENEREAQGIISAYKNSSTLQNMVYFKDATDQLSTSSSLTFYKMNGAITQAIASFFTTEIATEIKKSTIKNYPFAALQLSHDRDFAHVNLVCKETSKSSLSIGGITQQFSVLLDNEILMGPQFFSNHRTGGKDIVVQDIANKLYLISENGKILWTKNLPNPILGSIHEVDILRNGKKQLAFTTKNEFYVLDRNRNSVGSFPLKFRDEITQPLSVFDYDNNRKYRFVITQGKNILMYDAKGKLVKGFTFKKTSSNIVLPPQHIRIGTKDYILIPEQNGSLHILSRVGKSRVKVSKKFSFTDIPIAEEGTKFVVITTENTKESISQTGSVSSQKLDVSNNYYFSISGNTKVTLDDNLLRINGKLVELPFGIYSLPKIYTVNRDTYITITETQENKVYLFNRSGTLIQGFPVYGTTSADIGNTAKNKGLHLVVQGEGKEVILYSRQ
jgi:hypothetical protein